MTAFIDAGASPRSCASILGGNGFTASAEKMPGILMALGGAIGFALGTVLAKRLPIKLPPITAAAWQIGIGCFPVMVAGLAIETRGVELIHRFHHAHAEGLPVWRERPVHIRKNTIARVPPLAT